MVGSKIVAILFIVIELGFGVTSLSNREQSNVVRKESTLKRSQFSPDFLFGATSSSYQYEGGTWKDGRRPSIWDAYSHSYSDRILDGSNGDVATDSYRLYKDDIALVKQMGMNTYRFSVSWSRVLPNGKLSGGINKRGIEYYNKVINEIISQGLTPFVTLLHLDYPQALQDEYDGFLSRRILNDFRNFADLCFKEFGDRVKYWVSINEPHTLSRGGFTVGDLAPGRCSNTHATVVQLYRRKYQAAQKGIIGMSMNVDWFIPYSSSEEDKRAANRSLDFMFGWFMDPITRGDYPESMKQYVGKRLPRFTKQESELMKGSFDFIGVNYYTGRYVIDQSNAGDHHHPGYLTDALASITRVPETGNYTHSPLKATPDDNLRVSFYKEHLASVRSAIKQGANVKGFLVWSLLDCFEWLSGYHLKFGLYFVDPENPSIRIPKLSAIWFRKFLNGNS
ncbi:Beta-glucosidase 24 [Linum perenne]